MGGAAPLAVRQGRRYDAREPHEPGPGMIRDLWYKNDVIYCLSVGSFMDANGDAARNGPEPLRRSGVVTSEPEHDAPERRLNDPEPGHGARR